MVIETLGLIFFLTGFLGKAVFHFIYLNRANQLMDRFEKMGVKELVLRYFLVITPLFVSDGIAESKYQTQLRFLKNTVFVCILIAIIGFGLLIH